MLELIKETWPSFGVSIVSNGWTNATCHPLIKFMVSSLNGPIFLKAVDALCNEPPRYDNHSSDGCNFFFF
jgi:hypothetical protein